MTTKAPIENNSRFKLILIGLWGLLLLSGCLIDQIGGAFSNPPEDLERNVSKATRELIERAYEDIDPTRIVDHHVHVLAVGTSAADAFVNPRMRHGFNLERLKFQVYASASGIKHIDDADREYVERLARLIRTLKYHGKYRILAFDKHYRTDGAVDFGKTNMYVPNRYVVELANKYPDIFTPAISVHPYRADALQELETWAKAGVRYVKWLPNAMGMEPANPSIDPFYFMMKKYRMILLSHTGEEQAVEAEEDQRLGNPLLLRRPLDLGVRVIMAHSASLGTCDDVDHGGGKSADCFDLFLRLMDEVKYRGLLFGELSAMTQFNRMPGPLAKLLTRQDLHPRLVNGSDYPLPAINALIRTTSLASQDFITTGERQSLNEIYDHNPLLFDFVLKRTLRHPKTQQKLAASIFMANPGLEN